MPQVPLRTSGLSLLWSLCEIKRFETKNQDWAGLDRECPDLSTIVIYESVTGPDGTDRLEPCETKPLELLDLGETPP